MLWSVRKTLGIIIGAGGFGTAVGTVVSGELPWMAAIAGLIVGVGSFASVLFVERCRSCSQLHIHFGVVSYCIKCGEPLFDRSP